MTKHINFNREKSKREREKKGKEMCVSPLPLMVPALCTNEDLRATENKNVLMLNK
jgi:hypothetical protein